MCALGQGRHALQVKYDNRNAKSVLYLSFDDLSIEVARMWGWPDSLQKALRPYLPEDPEHEISRDGWKQTFSLQREGLGSTVASVRV